MHTPPAIDWDNQSRCPQGVSVKLIEKQFYRMEMRAMTDYQYRAVLDALFKMTLNISRPDAKEDEISILPKISTMAYDNGDDNQRDQITTALVEFTMRASSKEATKAQLAALPEVGQFLLSHNSSVMF